MLHRQDTWPGFSVFIPPLNTTPHEETLYRGVTRTPLCKDWLHNVEAPGTSSSLKAILAGLPWSRKEQPVYKLITDALDHRPPSGLQLLRAYSSFGRNRGF